MKHKVYIIILNYNGWQDTIECLESTLKSNYKDYQIIVVDNASQDHSMEHITAWAEGRQQANVGNPNLAFLSSPHQIKPIDYVLYDECKAMKGGSSDMESGLNNQIILIQSSENKGFAAGNNVGINYAMGKRDAEYIWLLNNDTVIEKNTLSELVNKAISYKNIVHDKKVGIIGTKLMYYHTPEIIQGIGGVYSKWSATSKHIGTFEPDNQQYDNEEVFDIVDYPIGASMLVSTAFINDVGLMCEDYFLYYEELDWVIRGKLKGWQIGYCWKGRVFHKEGASIGSNVKGEERSVLSDYYSLRNRIVFTKKFYPQYTWCVRLGFGLVLINRIRRLQFDRLKMVIRAVTQA